MDLVTAGFLCAATTSSLLEPCHLSPILDPARAPETRVHAARTIAKWQPLMAAAAQRFAVPEAWIGAVMMAESAGQTRRKGRPITSPAGAMGLMQIMPGTFRDLRTAYRLGSDPYDPVDNVFAGTAYLRALYQRYGYPNLFAAYQAGPARLDAFFDHRARLPQATRAYLNRLIPGATMGLPPLKQLVAQRCAKHSPCDAFEMLWPLSHTLFFVHNTRGHPPVSSAPRAPQTEDSSLAQHPSSPAGSLFVALAPAKP